MSHPPSVTVITPTWNRHDLLLNRCIPSVRWQTYQRFEHIVVSDGPDAVLRDALGNTPDVRYMELPEHAGDVLYGSQARRAAQAVTSGELIAHLDDDNAWRPLHLELLIARLEETGADFVYSQMKRYPFEDIVGSSPPRHGNIDTSLIVHRRELLSLADWTPHPLRQDPDWELVEKWMASGATWAFVPEITCDYYLKGAPCPE